MEFHNAEQEDWQVELPTSPCIETFCSSEADEKCKDFITVTCSDDQHTVNSSVLQDNKCAVHPGLLSDSTRIQHKATETVKSEINMKDDHQGDGMMSKEGEM